MGASSDSQGNMHLAFWGVVGTNALPLFGVLVWDWNLAVLILVYWLEVGIALLWAAIEAGLAEQPSEYSTETLLFGAFRYRRGGIAIPGTQLTWYVHNLPIVAIIGILFGSLWAIVGAIAFESVLGWQDSGQSTSRTVYSVLGVGTCLFASRGWETLSRYVGERHYHQVNAQQTVQDAMWPLFVLGLLVMIFAPTIDGEVTSLVLLVALMAGKFLFDLLWLAYGSIRAFDEDNGGWLGVADTGDEPAWNPRPLEASPTTIGAVRPRRLGIVLGGAGSGFASVLGELFGILVAFVLFALLLGGNSGVLWWPAIPFVLVVGIGVLDHVLRYWWPTYRIGEKGSLVADGRLLTGVHWHLEPEQLSAARPIVTRTDRLLGTTTIGIDLEGVDEGEGEDEERTIRLPFLTDRDARVVLESVAGSDHSDSVVA